MNNTAVDRGSPTDRPRVPWLARIGTKNGEVTSLGMVLRTGAGLLALANPLAAVVLTVELLTLSRTRVRGWWLLTGGLLALVVCLALGQASAYVLIWRDLGTAFLDVVTDVGARSLSTGVDAAPLTDALSSWPQWLAGQAPIGLALGTAGAGAVIGYRARYAATWRAAAQPPTERALAKAAVRLDAQRTDAAPVDTADEVLVALGVDRDTAEPFAITGAALRMHMVIGGPTGFGKSTTLQRVFDQLAGAPLPEPIGLVLIDMKADPGMVDFLRALAAATGRRFHLVTVDPITSTRWNPLRRGGPSEIRSRLFQTEGQSATGGFNEPHYRVLGERFLLVCAKVLVDLTDAGHQVTVAGKRRPWRQDLGDLLRLMSPKALAREVDRLSPSVAADVTDYLHEVEENENLARDLYGIYGRFKLWHEGPAGQILTDAPTGLDLHAAIGAGDIVLFSLDAAMDAATAGQLGNLALQELTYAQAQHGAAGFAARGRMTFVAVDEFSALGGSQLANMFARLRSAGGAVCLASQALYADLGEVSEGFRAQVLTNANVTVLHQQRNDEPAMWAEAIGTSTGWKETLQVTDDISVLGTQAAASGVGSLREADSFVVHPNVLRNLPRGHAVVIVGHPERTITTVAVVPAVIGASPRSATRETASMVPEERAGSTEPLAGSAATGEGDAGLDDAPATEPDDQSWSR